MAEDISGEVAELISDAKVFGSSENIRHGKYKFLIKRIHAQKVTVEKGDHKMAFVELTPLESMKNPQFEGDHVDYPGTAGPLKDDGNNPNPVGSNCALKVDFDGPGGRSAGSNIKAFVLGLFGKHDGEIPKEEINKTWRDLARLKELKVGDPIGIDANTNTVVVADKAKQANPACGMVIYCDTMPKRKRTPNEKGAYVTKLVWSCKGSPPGVGENALDLVTKRKAEVEAARGDEEDEETTNAPPSAPGAPAPYAAPQAVSAPPPPAPPAPSAPPPPTAAFTPTAPWIKHPTAVVGPTPESRFYWSDPTIGGNNAVKSEAQLRNGA